MGKKISQITAEETSAFSDTDVFEGEEPGGISFKILGSVIKSTIATYLASLTQTLTNKTISAASNLFNRYSLQAQSTANTPADATSYYFGPFSSSFGGAAANQRLYIPYAGTITRAYIFITCVAGSNETSTLSLRLNDTSDTTLSAAINLSASPFIANKTDLAVAVAAGDYVTIKWVTPTWATNPTSVSISVVLFIE